MSRTSGGGGGGKVDESQGTPWLPPGFRFHPTDEELVTYYLHNKVANTNLSVGAITEVDLNKCEPWDLPAKAKMGEKEWYFFSLRDRKYPTGMRTNRATEAGYWKATGKDREVMNSRTHRLVGMKKTLVFYRGRAPKGEKTNWIMHEYRIEGDSSSTSSLIHSPKLSKDEWVVCRIFQKSAGGKKSPMDCNRSSSYNTDPQGRSSLPALLESPNLNSVGEESDTCLIDGSFHPMDNGNNNVVGGGSKSTCNSGGWPMKMELNVNDALENLQAKNGNGGLLRCNSFLLDMLPIELGGTAPSLKGMESVFGPKLARQETFSLQQAQQIQQTLKYLEQQQQQQQRAMRPCKAEPYGGEEDDAQSSQRSSLMESWVAESSGGFENGAAAVAGVAAGGLPSLGNVSGVPELDTASMFRFTRGPLFTEPPNHCGDILGENLWAY
ncbi:hypothetical protein R1sor_004944 [Riccia sorocarpa]|uniref:NAC domain-containing protein n=1 Tax=Riccia sorocarpa TaxID=122646 RepID=A0ABD3HI36_9MARC